MNTNHKEEEMEAKSRKRLMAMLLIGALAVMSPQLAMALTPACTPIDNMAAVTYSVGGVAQTGINSTTSFTVGNKVNLTVTRNDASYVSVPPGSTNQTLTFTVTNIGNAHQRYLISYTEPVGGADPFTGTDNFNTTNPGVGAVGVASIVTGVIVPGGTYSATIVSNIPVSRVNGDIAVYGLLAKTYKVDGTTLETGNPGSITSAYGTCSTDIVLADAAGTDDPTGARDGANSVRGAYKVSSSVLSFSKTSTTIWDPVNFNVAPKAIPGALIRYTITVTNDPTAASSAVLTTITDGLNANTAIDPNLKVAALTGPLTALVNESGIAGKGFKVVVTGSTRALNGTSQYFTTTSDVDGVDIAGQNITATMTTVLPAEGSYAAGELKAGESVTLTLNVVIQ